VECLFTITTLQRLDQIIVNLGFVEARQIAAGEGGARREHLRVVVRVLVAAVYSRKMTI